MAPKPNVISFATSVVATILIGTATFAFWSQTVNAQAVPPVSIDVIETISVNDSPKAVPPVSVDVAESIGVADVSASLPPVSLTTTESIGVSDVPQVAPPASVITTEAISVADTVRVVPPGSADVAEAIGVTDTPEVIVVPTFTCDKSWDQPVSGNWSDATKWSPAGVPDATQDVCMTTDGTYTVKLNGRTHSVKSVTLGALGNIGVQTLLFESSGDYAYLTVANGFVNHGAILMDSPTSNWSMDLTVTTSTLVNLGTITTAEIGGAGISIAANIDNHGTFEVGTLDAMTLSGADRVLNNYGAVTLGNVVTASAGGQIFNQIDGTFDINSDLNITNGTFNLNGGMLDAGSTLRITTGTFNANGGTSPVRSR